LFAEYGSPLILQDLVESKLDSRNSSESKGESYLGFFRREESRHAFSGEIATQIEANEGRGLEMEVFSRY